MTEYVSFYRPGEVTLLLEPADTTQVNIAVQTSTLNDLHDLIKSLGIGLHAEQLVGHAGQRLPVVLQHCENAPHFVHTVNLASWITPEKQRGLNLRHSRQERRRSQGSTLWRACAAMVDGLRRRGERLVDSIRTNAQQKAIADVLKVVNVLNDPRNADALRQAPFRLLAATPNWLATPAQTF